MAQKSKEDKDELIKLIGQEKYDELNNLVPDKIKQDTIVNFSDYLLNISDQEISNFYNDLINGNQQAIPKIVGNVVILTSHVHDLLIRLLKKNEADNRIINQVSTFDLHYLIMYCTAKYNIPANRFVQMMELKHFRNMIAHDFNRVMETSFNQAIHPIGKGYVLVIELTELIKK